MLHTKVKDLDVFYTEDDDIESISTIIKNNYDMLFKRYADEGFYFSTVPNDDDNCVHTDDFQKDIGFMISEYYYLTDDEELGRIENLSALYATLLIQSSGVQNPFFDFDFDLSAEMTDTVIAKQYYLVNGSAEDFVEYAKYRNPEERKKILYWLRENCRYETYNYILDKVCNYLKDNGFDFLASSASNNIFVDIIKNYNEQNNKNYNLPKMSKEDIDKLFYEFLKYINAPESWRKLYNNLKRNNGIHYEISDGKEVANCYKDEVDEDYSISIKYNGTTTGFCSLVHEFIHYITFCTEKFNFSLAEFPSIYFEKIASQFLKDKGYSQEVVEETIASRNENNIEILMALSTLFTDVNTYMKRGVLTKEDKINLWQEQMMTIYRLREKYNEILKASGQEPKPLPSFPSIEQLEQEVDEDCDDLIEQFITNNVFMLDGYQYLLGTSLAESILNKEGKASIPKMIDVVEDLPSYDANMIASEFNINKDCNGKKITKEKISN